jgi:hypothetical protein
MRGQVSDEALSAGVSFCGGCFLKPWVNCKNRDELMNYTDRVRGSKVLEQESVIV